MAEHRSVLRHAFARHGGVEVDTQGDAFFYAFARASEAVEAAREGAAGLRGGPILVRIGLNTGADLHRRGLRRNRRAPRGPDRGRGPRGQVLLSRATRDLVDAPVRDLGEHRLKDLSAPERIFQRGEAEFPPLKALYGTNLPFPSTPFVGRERELQEVGALLAREDVRLLT